MFEETVTDNNKGWVWNIEEPVGYIREDEYCLPGEMTRYQKRELIVKEEQEKRNELTGKILPELLKPGCEVELKSMDEYDYDEWFEYIHTYTLNDLFGLNKIIVDIYNMRQVCDKLCFPIADLYAGNIEHHSTCYLEAYPDSLLKVAETGTAVS